MNLNKDYAPMYTFKQGVQQPFRTSDIPMEMQCANKTLWLDKDQWVIIDCQILHFRDDTLRWSRNIKVKCNLETLVCGYLLHTQNVSLVSALIIYVYITQLDLLQSSTKIFMKFIKCLCWHWCKSHCSFSQFLWVIVTTEQLIKEMKSP